MSGEVVFVEQAEYLAEELFLKLTSEHPNEGLIISKLAQRGAKLLVGPRGCGKTTLMLKAYYSICKSNGSSGFNDVVAIYVNYKSTLKLEPFYKKYPNAMYWFNQWLLFKLYKGFYKYIQDAKFENDIKLSVEESFVDDVISELELGNLEFLESYESRVSVEIFEADIKKVLKVIGKTRCILLLDDAAHAFSVEQQKDFFDLFRSLKSKIISPKAAIYPGVTNYSSAFHVGHDAEEVDVWIKPSQEDYLDFMNRLVKKRLPEHLFAILAKNQTNLEFMYYAAFGLPRVLLNMIREQFSEEFDGDNTNKKITITNRSILAAVSSCYKSTMSIYISIKDKIPMYSEFVLLGRDIYEKMISIVKSYNKGKPYERQSVTIAIKQPLPPELTKIVGFLQYAGLLLPVKEVSKGEGGRFELFEIHCSALIDFNSIGTGRGKNIPAMLTVFKNRNAHDYTKVSVPKLVGNKNINEIVRLSLPPCQACKTPRLSESQKFCHNCGAALKVASLFESLVEADISELGLTSTRVARIKEGSKIHKVKDVLMDNDNSQLRSVKGIGTKWAQRIKSYAEEFIA